MSSKDHASMSENRTMLKYTIHTGEINVIPREVEADQHVVMSDGKELQLFKNGNTVFVVYGFERFKAEPVKQGG